MSDLRKIVQRELEKRGWTPTELARVSKVPQPTIQRFLKGAHGEPRTINIRKIAEAFGMTELQLRGGEIDGVMTKKDSAPQYIGGDGKKVPLISYVSAGSWCEAIDNYSVGDAEGWYDCPIKCSSNTYALRVRGDSMTSAHGRSYPEGIIIYVDPQVTPASGSRVIAKIAGTNEVTFKELRFDSGRVLLKPLNTQYPTIDITDKEYNICGVIIGSYVPE